ncbi:MAG TPA: CoA transferase subunit A [candidate division WOR-3 bacterium]|uniref:CoA transferase subunit A n=1 Tax=candidate division WOR-3 bacterium TaxID=2052148 RepID=A0A7V0T651_UNCW3|nr:CoA transferase subunit A [candidate division WOR-3 bacterium]
MEVIESGIGELFQPPDPDGFREWVRTGKNTGMTDKVMSEQEAVSRLVQDGDYIGTELYGTVRAPMSLVREVVRQGKKHLRVAGQGIHEIDLLLAADLVDSLDITYVAWEVYGISACLRRAVESGRVKTTDWSNGGITWRFKAAAMGVPFLPVRAMLGTDTFKHSASKVVADPFTGKPVCLVPALFLDVGLIHVHKADKYGNCRVEGISGFVHEMARASKKLIVSAEEIVPTEEIRRYPEQTVIPYYLVDAVVEAKYGSHPGEMCYRYWRDGEHLQSFLKDSKDPDKAKAYLDKWVYGCSDHAAYVELVGADRLGRLESEIGGR